MKFTKLVSMLAVAACFASVPLSRAADRVSLFDGKSLTGWTLVHCDAVVDNGEIFIKGGNGLVQTEKKYTDFVFEWDWKALHPDMWDSGVYFRYDGIPEKRAWPLRYQANLRKGLEGNVDNLKEAKSTGLVKDHEWNTFKLTVRGTKCELEINGKPAWKADGLRGDPESFIALQAEVPGGGQHRFRNIYITELK